MWLKFVPIFLEEMIELLWYSFSIDLIAMLIWNSSAKLISTRFSFFGGGVAMLGEAGYEQMEWTLSLSLVATLHEF